MKLINTSHLAPRANRKAPGFTKALSLLALTASTSILVPCVQAQGPAHNIPTRYVGMNVAGPSDSVRWPMFANVAKTGRYAKSNAHGTTDNSVLDSDGNPNQDFSFSLWDSGYVSLGKETGLYTITFNGKADITPGAVGPAPRLTFVNYVNNVSTWTLNVEPNTSYAPYLKVENTDRDGNGLDRDGVTNFKVMRPSSPGAGTSYSPSTVFTAEFIALMRNFDSIREMSNIAAGGNDWESSWNERIKPSEPQNLTAYINETYGRTVPRGTFMAGRGRSHEYLVALANEADVDVYFNIPIGANDEYITKLAQLIRYGSNGVEPYTSTQSNPVYPPLEAGRKFYLELGNEVWNDEPPYWYNQKYVDNQVAATPANDPIRYDGTTDTSILRYRWLAQRTLQMSNLFRDVWQTSAMNTTVRPILSWQKGSGHATHGLWFLHNYYNNGEGVQRVANPKPVNYYIWGGGGTFYNDSTPPTDPPTTFDDIYNNWDQDAWVKKDMLTDITWAKSMGLAFYSYEGGPSLGADPGGTIDIWRQAWLDPRIKNEVIDTMNAIEDLGADGGHWFSLSGSGPVQRSGIGLTWDFAQNMWNPTQDSPKFQGIVEINNTSTKRTPTYGVATGSSGFKAAAYPRTTWGIAHDQSANTVTFQRSAKEGYGYLVRATSGGTYNLRVQYTGPKTKLRVIANGHIAGVLSLPARNTLTWTYDMPIVLGAGVNGVRLINIGSNDIQAANVVIDTSSSTTPPPSPGQAATVTFEPATVGTSAKEAVYLENGYSLQESGGDGYIIKGTAQGFSNKVYAPENWSHTTSVANVNGGIFDITSFELIGSHPSTYSKAITITGTKPDGTTVTRSLTPADSTTKARQLVTLNWKGLELLQIAFSVVPSEVDNFIFTDAGAAPPSATTTLAPVADAHVRDGSFASQNYGGETLLQAKRSPDAGFTRHSYLKFDTSSFVGTAGSVTLRLHGNIESSSSNLDVQVAGVSNSSWTESGLTWSNAPTGSVGSVLATRSVTTVPQYWNWDVTSFVNAERAAGRPVVTLRVISNTASGPRVMLNSRENAANKPQLVLTPSVTAPVNLLTNGSFDAQGFDTQSPSGWVENEYNPTTWAEIVPANAVFTETTGGSKSGARHATHQKATAFATWSGQTVTGLQNGTYVARAWVKSSGAGVKEFWAGHYGGSKFVTIPTTNTWTQIQLTDIQVTNGQCEIGVWTEGAANSWVHFDDVELVRQ